MTQPSRGCRRLRLTLPSNYCERQSEGGEQSAFHHCLRTNQPVTFDQKCQKSRRRLSLENCSDVFLWQLFHTHRSRRLMWGKKNIVAAPPTLPLQIIHLEPSKTTRWVSYFSSSSSFAFTFLRMKHIIRMRASAKVFAENLKVKGFFIFQARGERERGLSG